MGKFISRKQKAPTDFKKKTAKVGKQIKRENVTKISVKSKVIYVPNQSDEKFTGSIQAVLDKQVQFLHHHAPKTREFAVQKLIDMISKSQVDESLVPILINAVVGLLHDETSEVRAVVLKLFIAICIEFPNKSIFAGSVNLVATYACSSLTSLQKVFLVAEILSTSMLFNLRYRILEKMH